MSKTISTWCYTFHLVHLLVPVPFPCSVNIPLQLILVILSVSHTHSPSDDIVVTRQEVHANVVNFTVKIINKNYWQATPLYVCLNYFKISCKFEVLIQSFLIKTDIRRTSERLGIFRDPLSWTDKIPGFLQVFPANFQVFLLLLKWHPSSLVLKSATLELLWKIFDFFYNTSERNLPLQYFSIM